MFSCKVCVEKNLRISELKEQIEYLKKQLNPPPQVRNYELQQDLLLDGGNREEVEPQQEIDDRAEEIAQTEINREHDAILAGNYEEREN